MTSKKNYKDIDRGSVQVLPLAHNLDNETDGWMQVNCPRCGKECYVRPWGWKVAALAKLETAMCSECFEQVYRV